VIQHKWLIEPDAVNESKACDEELASGIAQVQAVKDCLRTPGNARQLVAGLRDDVPGSLGGIVICKGLEPTGFVDEIDVPVVTEHWFERELSRCKALGELYELARSRPDRQQLAREWRAGEHEWRLAGFILKMPVMEKWESK
jgi:hypothetical protein